MSATTLQDLLYELARTEERLAELQAELANTRAKLATQREQARKHLARLDPHDEAYEAYGRAYWLDDSDRLCSMKLRPSYDVVLEPEDPDLVVLRNVPAHGETRDFA
jgi:hypothetical protein